MVRVAALFNALVPVLYSFALVLLVISSFAVIATDMFGVDPNGTGSDTKVPADDIRSARFGNLERTVFSLFTAATGDGWSTELVAGLVDTGAFGGGGGVQLFFVVFFLVVGIVLINVVIAVLLDEFLRTVNREKAEHRQQQHDKFQVLDEKEWPLDPLLAGLVTFTTENDLLDKIGAIYDRMDRDESGAMSRHELNNGLRLYSLGKRVQLSEDEFDEYTQHGKLTNTSGAWLTDTNVKDHGCLRPAALCLAPPVLCMPTA